jgi:HSP20 family protein
MMMNRLVRYDALPDRLDDLFAGFFRPVADSGRAAVTAAVEIRVDVREDDKAYVVDAVVPGVRKEDINVAIDGNEVSISAEVRKEKETKEGERVLRSERYYGKTARSFALAQEIDEANASARYADGILTLTLPKKAVPSARKITIQ